MQDQEVYFYTQTSKIHTVKSRFNKRIDSIKSVAIAFYYSGADAKILYDLASSHEGIVIAGSGSGNYSQAWLKAIEELSEKGTIFVRSSRISQGIVFDDEIFDPHHLCISSNTLSHFAKHFLQNPQFAAQKPPTALLFTPFTETRFAESSL